MNPRSTEGLRASTKRRKTEARAKIRKALRDMKRHGLPININAVAKRAQVARKTIYNHPDLEQEIRAAATTAAQPSAKPPVDATTAPSSTTAAPRHQLRSQKNDYDADVNALKSQIERLQEELVTAHSELRRLRNITASWGGAPGSSDDEARRHWL